MNQFPSSPIPSYPLSLEQEWKNLKTDFESGTEQRRQVWAFPKRRLTLKFNTLTQANVDTLYAFFTQQKGSFSPFYFFYPLPNPDGTWQSHTNEYVGRGTGAATIFELPSKTTTGLTVYINNIVTPVMFLSNSGEGGVDRIQFSVTGNVTSSSVANPTVITTDAAHGLITGNIVTIAGHTGSTPAISGVYTVTVLSSTTFSIPVNVTVGGTGGTWTVGAPTSGAVIMADFTGQIRYRMRFKDDKMSKELFDYFLYNCGIELQEVRA